MPSPAEKLRQLGGVATRADLVAATSRAEVDRALADATVLAVARGRYLLPEVEQGRQVAHRLAAALSHRSAALHWGWAVKHVPARPEVIVPRNRNLSTEQRQAALVHRGDLAVDDVVDGATSRARTMLDCLRSLPGDEALAIADSALREGESHAWLTALARDARGRGSATAREVAALASEQAANPFESVLRWIGHDLTGLSLRPQVSIYAPDFLGRPDLVDEDLRIIAEADSFEWHGGRADLARDARRYNAFVVNGWLVLRFSWDDVMHHPDLVRETLIAAVAERTNARCGRCRVA